jgi:hypothetical protein
MKNDGLLDQHLWFKYHGHGGFQLVHPETGIFRKPMIEHTQMEYHGNGWMKQVGTEFPSFPTERGFGRFPQWELDFF